VSTPLSFLVYFIFFLDQAPAVVAMVHLLVSPIVFAAVATGTIWSPVVSIGTPWDVSGPDRSVYGRIWRRVALPQV
jgi:hypothetical protein